MAGNSAEFGEFWVVVRFWVENRTKIVPREGDLTAAQEGLCGPFRPAAAAAFGPVGDQQEAGCPAPAAVQSGLRAQVVWYGDFSETRGQTAGSVDSALRRLLALAQEGEQERHDEAIADASGVALDLDERREVDDFEVEIASFDGDAVLREFLIAAAIVQAA